MVISKVGFGILVNAHLGDQGKAGGIIGLHVVKLGLVIDAVAAFIAAAPDHDAGAVDLPRPQRHGRRQVHGERHRAENAVGVIHQVDELPQAGFADQVDGIGQRRMPMAGFAALHEAPAAAEVIDDGLVGVGVPPFGGEVGFAAGDDDPEGAVVAQGGQRGGHAPLIFGEMDIALEGADGDSQPQLGLQIEGHAVDEMKGALIGLVNQRIFAVEHPIGLAESGEGCNVGIVQPEIAAWGVNGGEKPAGMGAVEVANDGREHQHIAGALAVPQQQFHRGSTDAGLCWRSGEFTQRREPRL